MFSTFPRAFMTQVYVSLLTYTTYLFMGIGESFTSLLIPQLLSPNSTIHLTENEASWIVTLNMFPNVFGSIIGGFVSDTFGRKVLLSVIYAMFAFNWCCISFASNLTTLYITMSINGIASSMAGISVSYLSEISSEENRGLFTSLLLPASSLGPVICNFSMYLLNWRRSAVVFFLLSLLNFLAVPLTPESPFWLVKKNRTEDARKILARIRETQLEVQKEMADLENRYRQFEDQTTVYGTLSRISRCWRSILLVYSLLFLTHATGLVTLTSYTAIFFAKLQVPLNPAVATVIYSSAIFTSACIGPILAHKLPPKQFLTFCATGMTFFMFTVSTYETIFLASDGHQQALSWVVLFGMYGYAFFHSGILVTALLLYGYLIPVELRGVITGLLQSSFYLTAALFVKIFPTFFLGTLGVSLTLWSFFLASVATLLIATYFVPDTNQARCNDFNRATHCNGDIIMPIGSYRSSESLDRMRHVASSIVEA